VSGECAAAGHFHRGRSQGRTHEPCDTAKVCIGADTTEELDYVPAPVRNPGVCATEVPVRELLAGRRASGPAGTADREGTTGTGLIGAPGYLPVRRLSAVLMHLRPLSTTIGNRRHAALVGAGPCQCSGTGGMGFATRLPYSLIPASWNVDSRPQLPTRSLRQLPPPDTEEHAVEHEADDRTPPQATASLRATGDTTPSRTVRRADYAAVVRGEPRVLHR
jgi:hypothetical protein